MPARHGVAAARQVLVEHRAQALVVVDDEDAFRHVCLGLVWIAAAGGAGSCIIPDQPS
jgi:hypothetical protein